jgi:hypothetical protein
MTSKLLRALAGALTLGSLVACSDSPTTTTADSALSAAFLSVPLGYNNALSSYQGGPDGGLAAFSPRDRHGSMGRGAMMGGGLGGLFLGDGFEAGFGHGRHGDPTLSGVCTFSASTGRVTCPPVTRNGLTVERSAAYADASGALQQAFDSVTTNSINTRVSVSGTVTRRDSVRTTVQHSSDRTVTGMAKGSAQRTVNGTSSGQETTTGADTVGSFTVLRAAADTTRGVVIPVQTGTTRTYPIAGSVTRSMKVSITRAGSTSTASRREVVTYDGSATATVVITRDGTSTTCTLPLPHGRPNCP